MEGHPLDAIRNNVIGTVTVAEAATRGGVKKFVNISTDKAVRPVGVMGQTKRVAESGLRSIDSGPTTFVSVRFGNVLGSNGSVLPLFQKQIAAGGPVTVTDPDATRYFMLIAEAAQLVLQAGSMGKPGQVFFLDMGEPVKIVDLADNVIRLAGYAPGKDIQKTFTGLRAGERLTEELVLDQEILDLSEHPRIFVTSNGGFSSSAYQQDLDGLRHLVDSRDHKAATEHLQTMAERY
jgi:FlaA1/EpsC-like NDP-sugar epimerase